MTDLERGIVATLARMAQESLSPKAIYLTPADFAEIGRTEVNGLPIRERKGKAGSAIYSRFGMHRPIRRETADAAEQRVAEANKPPRVAVAKRPRGRPARRRPVPDDFRSTAPGRSRKWLQSHYRAGGAVVERWLAQTGITLATHRLDAKPCPADFARVAPSLTRTGLCRHYGVNREAIARWLTETGTTAATYDNSAPKPGHSREGCYHRLPLAEKRRRALRRNDGYAGPKSAFVGRLTHDDSLEGRAADHLRRLAAVYRCNERGGADQAGNRWRYGLAVLTGAELIERAVRHGFQPDAWRAIPAIAAQREGARP